MMTAGIDISTSEWRTVLMESDGHIAGSFRIPTINRPPAEISRDLATFFSGRNGKKMDVVLGVGGKGVVLRHLVLPRLERADLLGVAGSELASQMNCSIDNSLFDCSVIEDFEQDGISKVRVLAVSADRDGIVAAIETIGAGGGEVRAVEPAAFALLRYADIMEKPAAGRFWVQLHENVISVGVTADGRIIFWRDVHQDTSLIGESGARSQAAREQIVSEVMQSYDFFSTKHHQIVIDQAILLSSFMAGGSLRESLAPALELAMEDENPFVRLGASPNEYPETDRAGTSAYVVAAGLAMRVLRS